MVTMKTRTLVAGVSRAKEMRTCSERSKRARRWLRDEAYKFLVNHMPRM